MTRNQILDTMRYLGFTVQKENGELTAAALATASALEGKVIESVMLPSAIATEYRKQVVATATPNRQLNALIAGGQEIVDDSFLDEVLAIDQANGTSYGNEIRTCRNRHQVGTKDQYVAWIHDSATPKDLEFLKAPSFYALGSKDKETAS